MDQTEQKQTYLRANILQNNYDPLEFVDFLQQQREGGADINIWTLQELKTIVSAFIDFKLNQKPKPQTKQESKLSNNEVEEIIKSIIKQNIEQKKEQQTQKKAAFKQSGKKQIFKPKQDIPLKIQKKVIYEKYDLSDKALRKKLSCTEFKKYLNKDIQPIITVQKPEIKITGGFLGIGTTSEIWYSMKNTLIPVMVKRSDKDFQWLRNSLIKFYPGHIIPPLKNCKPVVDDKKALDKRCHMINFFMNSLAKYDLLFNTKMVINFLSWTDYHNFSKFKQEIDRTNFLKVFTSLVTENGNVELEISNENKRFIKSIDIYTADISQIFNSMKNDVRILMKNLDEIAKNLFKIGEQFGELQQCYSNLINRVPQAKNDDLNDVFISLNNIMIEWGKKFLHQKTAVDKHISLFFKECKQENQSIRQLIKRKTSNQQIYLNFRQDLNKRKQRIYPDVFKWQVPASILSKIPEPKKLPKEEAFLYMLPKQTDQQKKLRQWVSYLNKCCEIQFNKINPLIAGRINKAFSELGKDLESNYNAEHQTVARMSFLK